MTLIDWCLLGMVLLSAIVGIFRGAVREVLGLLGLFLSLWIAWQFGELLAPHLLVISSLPSVRTMAASVILFVGCLLIFTLIAIVIGKIVRRAGMGLLDRLLGAGFGVLRGVLIAAVLVMLAAMTPLKNDPWWHQSLFIPHLQWLAGELVKMAPAGWRKKLDPAAQDQQQT